MYRHDIQEHLEEGLSRGISTSVSLDSKPSVSVGISFVFFPRITIKLDRLIVLSKSSLLGWFLQVSLILIIKGRYPREVSLIVIIKQVIRMYVHTFYNILFRIPFNSILQSSPYTVSLTHSGLLCHHKSSIGIHSYLQCAFQCLVHSAFLERIMLFSSCSKDSLYPVSRSRSTILWPVLSYPRRQGAEEVVFIWADSVVWVYFVWFVSKRFVNVFT
jgi:hypothetical protein